MFRKFRSPLALLLICALLLTCLPAPALAEELEEAQTVAAETTSDTATNSAGEESAVADEGDSSTGEETETAGKEDASANEETQKEEPEATAETTWVRVSDSTEIAQLIRDNWSDDYFQEAVVDTSRNQVTLDGKSADFSEVFDDVTEDEVEKILVSAAAVEEYFADTAYETKTQSGGTVSVTAPYQTCRVVLYADALTEDYGAETILEYSAYDEYVLQFATAEDTQAAYEQIVARYGAEACYVDQIVTADDLFLSDEEDTTTTYSWGTTYMGLDTLKSTVSTGNDTVTVAIVDSGIDAGHEFFEGRTITSDSYDFLEDTTDLSDPYGHGTHVAGIIAEGTPDNVELLVLRVLNEEGEASLLLVNTAMQYALEHGANVINLSLGLTSSGTTYTYLDSVIQAAYNADVPVCCAAGNSKTDVSSVYPACNTLTIAVSAINSKGAFASSYSNYGTGIDFCAPGSSIVSALAGGGTTSKSGTSMAAAAMTAAMTYAITACPDATVDELYCTLQSCVTDLGDTGKDKYYGWGCVTGLSDLFTDLADCTVTLSQTTCAYSGAAQKPTVTVKNAAGSTLTKGTDYTVAYSDNINIGTATVTVTGKGAYTGSVTTTFSIRCAAPTLSSVTNTSSGVKVTWGKVSGATGYRVYRKADGETSWTAVKSSTTSTSYTDTTAKSGTVYSYTVRAYAKVNGSNVWGSYDTSGKSITRLNAPTLSGVTNASSGITVTWTKVTGAQGYRIYRKAGSASSWTAVKTVSGGSTLSWTDTSVSNGTKYTYTVRAYSKATGSTCWGPYDSTGEVAYRLTRPTISSLKNSSSKKMTVKWGKNSKATGYQIQYSTSSSFSSCKTVTVTSYKTVSKTISSLTKGKKYYVRVRAYKTVSGTKYYSAWSSTKNVKISK
ncbi:MAG: S8 family serine peptidase [Clostridiales bacterium]|nr:S8 family serine peptidase [Clostridiales bacterium]